MPIVPKTQKLHTFFEKDKQRPTFFDKKRRISTKKTLPAENSVCKENDMAQKLGYVDEIFVTYTNFSNSDKLLRDEKLCET